MTYNFNKDTENDAQVTGSVTDKIIYIKDLNYDKLVRCKDRAEAFLAYLVRIGRDPQVQVQFDFDPVSAY